METAYTFDGVAYRTRVITDGVRFRPQVWGRRWSWWRPFGWVRDWVRLEPWLEEDQYGNQFGDLPTAERAAYNHVAKLHREAMAKELGYRPVREILRPPGLARDTPPPIVADWLEQRALPGDQEDADALRGGYGHLVEPTPRLGETNRVTYDLSTGKGE